MTSPHAPEGVGGVGLELPAGSVDLIVARVAELVLERLDDRADGWPEWMGAETAARYLDVSVERVRKLQARRAIPFHQEGAGCRVFFRRADLDGWMQAQRVRR